MGVDDKLAYAHGLALLDRGAIRIVPGRRNDVWKDATEHRAHFGRRREQPPAEFAALWDWAEKHGLIQPAR